MKTCVDCGVIKPLVEFWKRTGVKDGRVAACIPCHKIRNQDRYQKHRTKRLADDRARYYTDPTPWRKHSRNWVEKNPEKRKEIIAKYKASHAIEIKARATLNHGLRDGKLEKLPCEICTNPKTVGHHDDYSKPLTVRWLCTKHHGAWHRVFSAIGGTECEV